MWIWRTVLVSFIAVKRHYGHSGFYKENWGWVTVSEFYSMPEAHDTCVRHGSGKVDESSASGFASSRKTETLGLA